MKKFKLLKNLTESEYVEAGSVFNGFSDPQPRTAMNDFGIFRDDSEQIQRINAFANAFLGGSYLEGRSAIALLRSKLNHAGLDFDFNNKSDLKVGYNSFQLNRYGEKFGTTPTHDLSTGFDKGKDYVPLRLSFNLIKNPDGKMYFTDISVSRTSVLDIPDNKPTPKVEERYDESGTMLLESSQMELSIMNMFMRNSDVKTKTMEPVFKSLINMRRKGTITPEETMNRLSFAAKSGLRRLARLGKIDRMHINDKLVTKVAKQLHSKFKSVKTLTGE